VLTFALYKVLMSYALIAVRTLNEKTSRLGCNTAVFFHNFSPMLGFLRPGKWVERPLFAFRTRKYIPSRRLLFSRQCPVVGLHGNLLCARPTKELISFLFRWLCYEKRVTHAARSLASLPLRRRRTKKNCFRGRSFFITRRQLYQEQAAAAG
jgi:hypothetical protein